MTYARLVEVRTAAVQARAHLVVRPLWGQPEHIGGCPRRSTAYEVAIGIDCNRRKRWNIGQRRRRHPIYPQLRQTSGCHRPRPHRVAEQYSRYPRTAGVGARTPVTIELAKQFSGEWGPADRDSETRGSEKCVLEVELIDRAPRRDCRD